MAVTSIWAVKNRMDTVINYVENPEKTTQRPEEAPAANAAMKYIRDVLGYACNEAKTDKMMYVTGINCDPDTALEDFMTVKRRWHKEGGRLAYHGYQAFKEGPGEITAEEAHEIGVRLAKELWGDRYQVVVATHLNTGHFHNHFVLNSVSYSDGLKYVRFKSDYRRMQEVSDRLCRERGFHIVRDPSHSKGMTYDEWLAEREGRYTIRGRIREDIDYVAALSTSWNEFTELMERLGYEFKFTGENGMPLKYPGLKPHDAKGYFRFKSLGPNYDPFVIKQRVIENTLVPGMPFPKRTYNYKEWEPSLEPMKGLPHIYRRYCFRLYTFVSSPSRRREYIPMALREDIRKLDKLIEQLDFIYKHGIETKENIPSVRKSYQERLDSLLDERQQLYRQKTHYEKSHNAALLMGVKHEIEETSLKIKDVRKQIKLCDECFKSVDEVVKRVDLPDRNPMFRQAGPRINVR